MHTFILTEEQLKYYTEAKDTINQSPVTNRRPKSKKRKIKTMPDETMFSYGNVSMMRACGRDVADPKLIQKGVYVGYNYTPKGVDVPFIGNGTVTDSKKMTNGKIAYKIEKDGKVIWIPEEYITTIPQDKQNI